MQTFLPFPDYHESAAALDMLRLGKQRVEVLQILNALHQITTGYQNHSCTRMWRGHEAQLAEYGIVICEEWIGRGYKDTVKPQLEQHLDWASEGSLAKPAWFGDPDLHDSHKSNLLRKADQYLRHHTDRNHEPHGEGRNKCNGNTPHPPHNNCQPFKFVEWYEPKFPGVPLDLPYVWPVQ